MNKIEFKECSKYGYKTRTEENILETDGTLMIYIDGYTGGECLTRNLCIKHNKPHFEIDWTKITDKFDIILHQAVLWMNKNLITKLNVAGNGVYTWKKYNKYYSQPEINDAVGIVLDFIDQEDRGKYSLDAALQLIQSGGQTGTDEAAIIWALKNNIPAKIIAPRSWIYRDEGARDIKNEDLFKERFKCKS